MNQEFLNKSFSTLQQSITTYRADFEMFCKHLVEKYVYGTVVMKSPNDVTYTGHIVLCPNEDIEIPFFFGFESDLRSEDSPNGFLFSHYWWIPRDAIDDIEDWFTSNIIGTIHCEVNYDL